MYYLCIILCIILCNIIIIRYLNYRDGYNKAKLAILSFFTHLVNLFKIYIYYYHYHYFHYFLKKRYCFIISFQSVFMLVLKLLEFS
jgi:hypothetical protein